MEIKNQENTAQRFNTALRGLGIAAVAASASIFMFQGLTAISSYERFLSFGVVTLALAILGVVSGMKMKETKSARAFLGLAAAATPVLFSQLGAMIFSAFETTPLPSSLPDALVISAPTSSLLLLALAGTCLVLTPILYVGFGAFFRARASHLVLLMFGCSSLLLIPSRDAVVTSALLVIQAMALIAFTKKSKKRPGAETESLVASLLPVLPGIIMVTRQVFYSSSDLLVSAFLVLMTAVFYEILPSLAPQNSRLQQLKSVGVVCLGGSWVFLASALVDLFALPEAAKALFLFYPAVIGLLSSPSFQDPFENKVPRRFLEFCSIALPVYSALHWWTSAAAMSYLLAGFSTIALGYSYRQVRAFGSGVFVSLMAFAYFLFDSFTYWAKMPWVSMAVLGMAAIFGSAWLEKNKGQLGQWRDHFQQRFNPQTPFAEPETIATQVEEK